MKISRLFCSTPTLRRWLVLGALAALLPGSFAQSPTPAAQSRATSPTPTAAPESDSSDEPVFKSAPQVRIDVLIVSVPQAGALALLPELRDEKKVAAAQAQLLQMVERKEATLVDWPEITTFSGQRAVTESIVEARYPIEFSFPKAPEKAVAEVTGKPSTETPKPPSDSGLLIDSGMAVPSAFEIKNTGATLEVESVVSPDGSSANINLAPMLVTLDRMEEFPAGKDAKGQPVTFSQPIFRTHKVQTTLTLRDGERRLIYVGKPLGTNTSFHFFILGLKIIPVAK